MSETVDGRADTPVAEASISVVIIHYRAPLWCAEAVRSVLESEGVATSVVVVDNSGDLSAMPNGVRVIRPTENVGYAGGANLALREWLSSGQQYCFVAAHDLTVEPHTLARLVGVAESNPDFGVIAPWFTPRVARVGELGEVAGITEFTWVSGSGYLLRRELLEQIGLFDEDFGSYCEDRELCMRARINGWRVGAVRGAGASSRGSAHHDTANVMMHGNQILLRIKYRDWREALKLVLHEIRSIPAELLAALSPSRSTRDALRRAKIHARTIAMASVKTFRWRIRGGQRGDPLSAQRRMPVASGDHRS
ncbi:MAG: glycosyltransferase family 2 protein [Microthrixaceae bacterium]